MTRTFVVDAVRTPIAKFLGSYSPLSAVDLGAATIRALLQRTGVPADEIGEVLFGQARQLGGGPNPARQVTLAAGLPEAVPATTINKACGSSLKAIDMGRAALLLDGHDFVVAGGMEHMTNIPFLVPNMRQGLRLGHQKVLDGNYQDGFTCAILKEPMGMTAEYVADDLGIGREEQDAFALESHRRAASAQQSGAFEAEIVPVEVATRKKTTTITTDEHVRPDVTLEGLQKLPPVFRPDGGTVHAGNSSGITDGAAAVLMATEAAVERHGLEPLAEVGASATAGLSPRVMGLGPVPATQKLFEKTGLGIDDFDLVEMNEAFAAQMLGCMRDLPFDRQIVNVNGGAIALGHPIGATGARIVTTLLHAMKARGSKRGLASLCMSGGMGMSIEFRRA
ncbi:MAG: thiolase family protein [Planctomycetota bacterium]